MASASSSGWSRWVSFTPFLTLSASLWRSSSPASSSKNADEFLKRNPLDVFVAERGVSYAFIHEGMTLLNLFDADFSGSDFRARQAPPHDLSDGTVGAWLPARALFRGRGWSSVVQVAKADEMAALGVARLSDQALLNEAAADLVVTSLDDVAVNALSEGRLDRQPFAEGRRPGQPTAATHKGR